MTKENKNFIYKVEDIFEDIPDDPENVLMNLPQEVMDEVGISPGDTVKILLGDQGSLIIEKIKENSGEEEQNTNEQA
jgi:bifunctional DNA-binding transcriptional regulator/antitoxin component of YhaV-PrlF toxin-antitoxin module